MTKIVFDVNNSPNEYTFDKKDFTDYDKDGISWYKKEILDTYTITQKSYDDVNKWYKINKNNTDWKTNSSYEKALNSVFYIIELTDNIYSKVIKSQHNSFNLLKTCLIKYIGDKSNSALRYFKNIFDVKCKILAVVKLKSGDKSGVKLNITKELCLKQLMNNNIYYFYLQTIKYYYPNNAEIKECYLYSYTNTNGKKNIIVYPDQINTLKDMKNVLEIVYNDIIDEKHEYKNIAKEPYYFMMEMLIYCDKYNESIDNNMRYIIKSNAFEKKNVDMMIRKYELLPYKKIKDFYDFMKLFINTEPTKISKKSQPSNNTEELKPKKVIKNKTTNKDKDIDTDSNIKDHVINKRKTSNKKSYDSDSETSDSEDNSISSSIESVKPIKAIKTVKKTIVTDKKLVHTTKTTTSPADLTKQSINMFIKNKLHKKKDNYIKLHQIIEQYKKSTEYKKINKYGISISRKYIVDYLQKYKWFRDNFREKYKDIRSVLLNYEIVN